MSIAHSKEPSSPHKPRSRDYRWECRQCGKTFLGLLNQLYCGKQCRSAAVNAERRSKAREGCCRRCGKPIVTPPDRRGRTPTYCSYECRKLRGLQEGTCKVCGKPFTGMISKQCCSPSCATRYAVRKHKERSCTLCGGRFIGPGTKKICDNHAVQTECLECGSMFPWKSPLKGQKYCSSRCCKNHQTRNRRALLLGAFVEDVPLSFLIRRDKGICQLCGKPVKFSVRRRDPLIPSLDHIVPLSQGGLHSKGNCQLAHMGCNSSKCNRKRMGPNYISA